MKHIKLFEEWLTDKSQPFLFEGGAAGHMAHPFDDKDLTFGDFKAMIDAGLRGELNFEEDATEVPAKMGDGSESAAGIAGDVMNMGKVKVQPEAKGEALVGEAKITEKEIKSADEFKEYAMAILKDAFGDDFDETKATETAEGLLKKYGEDYGAMVGALQSTMGS